MGLTRKRIVGLRIGELAAKVGGTTYYGGSPLAVNQSGTIELALCASLNLAKSNASAQSYLGPAANPSGVDTNAKDNIIAIYGGPCLLTLAKNSVNTDNTSINVDGSAGQTGDDFPYDDALTYKNGDRLYIGAAGKWTNVKVNSTDAHYAVVLKSGTGYLFCYFYGCPVYWDGANT